MRTGRPVVAIEERWRAKYTVVESGCWEWTSSIDSRGYGMIKHKNGKQIKAHRFSWMLHRGEIPKGIFVLHKCDNRKCVNPDHLFLGTHQDNMDDMVIKHRSATNKGKANGAAKLTEADIIGIRNALGNYLTQSYIGKVYGVSQTQISHINLRKQWGHI